MSRLHARVPDAASVDAALENRFSARAFLSRPVARADIEHVLRVASRAPSGTNTQPWKVYVLQGAARDALCDKVCAAHEAARQQPELQTQWRADRDYYPSQWAEPYLARRRENGWSLYGLLGIGRGDKDAMHAQHQRNYRFFDAPVGLIFTVDTALGWGSLLDYGMFLQAIMTSARAHGLSTCAQGAWNGFARIVLEHVGAAPSEKLVCGMALGYADEQANVNSLQTPREPVAGFTRWLD